MDHYQDEIADNDSSRKPDPIDIIVGANLKKIRLSRGMTQEMMAEAVGLTHQQIQKYERGTNRIGASRLVKLARALGAVPSDFFVGADVPGKAPEPVTDMFKTLSLKALELAMIYDAIVSPAQRYALRNLARTMAS